MIVRKHIGVRIGKSACIPLPYASADLFDTDRLARTRRLCADSLSQWEDFGWRVAKRQCASSWDRLVDRLQTPRSARLSTFCPQVSNHRAID